MTHCVPEAFDGGFVTVVEEKANSRQVRSCIREETDLLMLVFSNV